MNAIPLIGISRHRLATDGEGVTTLVAFHGCPLHCKYCLNPASLNPNGIWAHYDCAKLYEEIKKDELYFLATGGGVTFGGGEPCLQSEFIYEFRRLCGAQWKLTVETSLNVSQKHLEKLLPIIDQYIVDIKDVNDCIYQSYTGASNTVATQNLRYLIEQEKGEQIIVRIPLIPSYNTEADCENSIRILKEMGLTHFDRFTYKTTK